MPITLDQQTSCCAISLEGEININSAAELKTVVLQALSAGTDIHLKLERATELDITALQLLWAAEKQARGVGKGFWRMGELPPEVAAATAEAGFSEFPVPPQGSDAKRGA